MHRAVAYNYLGMKLAFVDFHPAAYTSDTPYAEPLGGTQSAVAYLAAALARRGHEVTVINAVAAPVKSAPEIGRASCRERV